MYTLKSKRTATETQTESADVLTAVASTVIEDAHYNGESDTIRLYLGNGEVMTVVVGYEDILIDGNVYSLYDALEVIAMNV